MVLKILFFGVYIFFYIYLNIKVGVVVRGFWRYDWSFKFVDFKIGRLILLGLI